MLTFESFRGCLSNTSEQFASGAVSFDFFVSVIERVHFFFVFFGKLGKKGRLSVFYFFTRYRIEMAFDRLKELELARAGR